MPEEAEKIQNNQKSSASNLLAATSTNNNNNNNLQRLQGNNFNLTSQPERMQMPNVANAASLTNGKQQLTPTSNNQSTSRPSSANSSIASPMDTGSVSSSMNYNILKYSATT